MTDGPPVRLDWVRRRGRERLRISGLDLPGGKPPLGLGVLPAELATADLQPLGGRFGVDGGVLYFTPDLPFVDGLDYALVARGDAPSLWTIARPASAPEASARVLGLHPTAEAVPLNLLKLYVYFSDAMSEGAAAGAVEVRREDTGEVLEDVFYRGRSELWDPARRRLTLLLDPGRIKRGLGPHEAKGYPLVEGVWVTVAITERFRDAKGAPLSAGALRRYWIGPLVREPVDPARWRLDWPTPATRDPLSVTFDRPLDHGLLQHALRVTLADGAPVLGEATIGAGETSWRFHPHAPWEAADYALVVDPVLEDLAGNSLTRVFDRDLERAEDAPRRGSEPVVFTHRLAARSGLRAS